MKVAHLIYGLKLGGLEQLVAELADRGRQRGIEPLLISFGENGPMREILERRNLPLVWLGDIPGMALPTLRRIGRALETFGADLAHAHDLGPWLNAVAARALRPKTSVVATFHQLLPPSGAKRVAATAAALFSKALVACGNEVRADIEQWLPPRAHLVTIGNGVPVPKELTAEARERARERLGLPQGATAVGYLGRLHEEKGADLLLEVFLKQFAAQPNVHLVLIGTGPLEPLLRERSGAHPNVHLTGEIAHGASELLQGLDIYAQGSRREGRSLSMLEAMAAGLPTVAHALGPIKEIHDPQTSFLVPLGDVPAFGAALQQLVDDPALRAKMGRAAREAVQRHSVDAMVDAYAALYAGRA